MKTGRPLSIFAAAALFAAAYTEAQTQRPGIDRPIRVGMFKGTGTGSRYWHTSMHTSHTVMASILANPSGAGLGPDLPIPAKGFNFYSMPVATDSTGQECSGNGCGPTSAQIAGFVAALDTLDVMILSNTIEFATRVTNSVHRQAVANFWTTKGYVGIHAIADQFGTWAPLDTIHGARFRGHPPEHQSGTLRRDSVFEGDPSWQYLNRGLFSNGLDTSLFEEWFYFTTNGTAIRSSGYLRPTVRLDESTIVNPGSQAPMGDHPMSWYKNLPTGGRVFYTALGHRADIWENARFFRRQVYNAILWTAKYDSLATTSVRAPGTGSRFTDVARMTSGASRLTVSVLHDGAHAVDIRGVDGRQVEKRHGAGRARHEFSGLRGGVYAVKVTTGTQSTSQLVTMP